MQAERAGQLTVVGPWVLGDRAFAAANSSRSWVWYCGLAASLKHRLTRTEKEVSAPARIIMKTSLSRS